jgi:hypothetical protein
VHLGGSSVATCGSATVVCGSATEAGSSAAVLGGSAGPPGGSAAWIFGLVLGVLEQQVVLTLSFLHLVVLS